LPYSPKIETIKIGNGTYMKIGIISDLHLAKDLERDEPRFKYYSNNTYIALNYLKKIRIDILIIVGDITHNGKVNNLLYFEKIFNSVYKDLSKPKVISFMGNHDYHDFNFNSNQNQKNFYDILKSFPNSHFIINNYDFIFWSQDNYLITEKGITNYEWIRNNLNLARKHSRNKGKPIFLFTHIPPKNTVYGSDILGHEGIYNLLKNYHEIICVSAHSHSSLKSIKSIWQGDFTVINTQGISYINSDNFSLDENEYDVRMESGKNCDSMGLIAHISDKNIIVERIEFLTEIIMKEKWKINFPLKNDNFSYTFEKRNKKKKPIFTNDIIKIEKKERNHLKNTYIIFHAAKHENYVNKYKIIIQNGINCKKKILYYYSFYYKNSRQKNKIMIFKLPKYLKSGKYYIEIYAYDAFDNESKPIKGKIII